MNSYLSPAFRHLSQELNLDILTVNREQRDWTAELGIILEAVTTRLYQHAQASAALQFPAGHVGVHYSAHDVMVVFSVSGRKHGLPLSAVMQHLIYTDAQHTSLRPEFLSRLHAPRTAASSGVGMLLSLIAEGDALDAILRVSVEDTAGTLELMLRSNLSPEEAHAALIKDRPAPAGRAGYWAVPGSNPVQAGFKPLDA